MSIARHLLVHSLTALSLLALAGCTTTTTRPLPQGADGVGAWSNRVTNPVSQPTIFEAPTIQGEVRPIVINQTMPSDSVFTGGDFQVYAVQLRVPISERLAFIATKDGYIDFNPDAGNHEEGFADIAAGFKYAAYEKDNVIITPGFVFEADTGDHEVFQGNGDGLIRPFVAFGWEPAPKVNVLGNVGFNLPMHGSRESHSIDYHVHVGYEATDKLTPLIELHGITYTKSGNSAIAGFEGGDLINIGSSMVAGQSVFTGAIGLRFQAAENISLGATYAVPVFTSRDDLFEDRFTIDATIRF